MGPRPAWELAFDYGTQEVTQEQKQLLLLVFNCQWEGSKIMRVTSHVMELKYLHYIDGPHQIDLDQSGPYCVVLLMFPDLFVLSC